jgi:hypothetical protein
MAEKSDAPPNEFQNAPNMHFPHETNWYAIALLTFFVIMAIIFLRIVLG